jgi:hypothetical protein
LQRVIPSRLYVRIGVRVNIDDAIQLRPGRSGKRRQSCHQKNESQQYFAHRFTGRFIRHRFLLLRTQSTQPAHLYTRRARALSKSSSQNLSLGWLMFRAGARAKSSARMRWLSLFVAS